MFNSTEVTLVTFKAIMVAASLVGNSLVCFLVIRNPDMRTAFNYTLVNLAGADILFTVFFFAHFISSHHLSSPYEMPGNAICMVFRKLTWLGSYSSVFTMIVIARERYYTIVHPRGNKGKLTMHNLKIIIPITWSLSMLISIRGFVLQSFSGNVPLKSCNHNWTDRKMYLANFYVWGFFVSGSVVLMIWLYSIVVYTLWFKRNKDNELTYQQQGVVKVRKRVTLMVLIVTTTFEICWITDTIIHLLQNAGIFPRDSYAIPIAHTLILFSSAINPFVYSLISQRFREKMKGMLCCGLRSSRRSVHTAESAFVMQMPYSVSHPLQPADGSLEMTSGSLCTAPSLQSSASFSKATVTRT
ncbi:neuropeptide FF receptor 1-like [Montipora capricornis]|uniref:neuropeptide FF receptor 1-like n=1 Tax=Montipora capricornis TaxID=246305 RepID=UPI0035F1C4BC